MRVFIAGGSGSIGRRLARALHADGHEVLILTRNADGLRRDPAMRVYEVVGGDPIKPGSWQDRVDGCDAIVNLAGHGIFTNRWNARVKNLIRDSRVHSAENLAAAAIRAHTPPKIFVQGSAVGYYGPRGDEIIDESGSSGVDFLAVVCRELEDAVAPLAEHGIRTARVRTGIVLEAGEGALKIMAPIFKMGPGAPIGSAGKSLASGRQYMSWIHMDDIVGIFRLALYDARVVGPLNGVAPNPVTNAEFARIFTSVLHNWATPWRFYVPFGPPDALLRLALGEVADTVTSGQRVIPVRALSLGFEFQYAYLDDALQAIFAPGAARRARSQAPAAAGHP